MSNAMSAKNANSRVAQGQIQLLSLSALMGLGIYFQGRMHQGLWTPVADAPVHINAKELMVLRIFLSRGVYQGASMDAPGVRL